MGLSQSLELKREDIEKLKMFKVLVRNAKFDLKGDAMVRCGSLMMWFEGLDTKLENMLAKKGAPKIEEMPE
jgi:hypothetical protein